MPKTAMCVIFTPNVTGYTSAPGNGVSYLQYKKPPHGTEIE